MMAGMLLAILTYRPLFNQLLNISDVTSGKELVDKKEIQNKLTSIAGTNDTLQITTTKKYFEDGNTMTEVKTDSVYASGKNSVVPQVKTTRKLGSAAYWEMVMIVFVMIVYVTMVYGPIAAFLVELFPTRIRYTSMSLPYHIGNGVFGGLTPFIATLLTTIYEGDKLKGLWYPILIAAICFVIGIVYLHNKIDPNVND
jgi:membrane-associated protease RseP (regulator of RpoE activity)